MALAVPIAAVAVNPQPAEAAPLVNAWPKKLEALPRVISRIPLPQPVLGNLPDPIAPLLLPAIQKVREAAARNVAYMKVTMQDVFVSSIQKIPPIPTLPPQRGSLDLSPVIDAVETSFAILLSGGAPPATPRIPIPPAVAQTSPVTEQVEASKRAIAIKSAQLDEAVNEALTRVSKIDALTIKQT